MGIGVSYTGHDGRTRSFTASSPEEAVAGLGASVQSSQAATQDALKAAIGSLGVQQTRQKDQPVKTSQSGSVTRDTMNGLCLRGEEFGTRPEDGAVYSFSRGRRGFHGIGELDYKVDGPVVGAENPASLEPGEGERRVGDRGGWRIPQQRVAFERETSSFGGFDSINVVNFTSFLILSESGRVVGKTAEKKSVVMKFLVANESSAGEEQAASGQFCVKPVFSGGVLSALLFGTDKELASGGYSSRVNTGTCPNAGR